MRAPLPSFFLVISSFMGESYSLMRGKPWIYHHKNQGNLLPSKTSSPASPFRCPRCVGLFKRNALNMRSRAVRAPTSTSPKTLSSVSSSSLSFPDRPEKLNPRPLPRRKTNKKHTPAQGQLGGSDCGQNKETLSCRGRPNTKPFDASFIIGD